MFMSAQIINYRASTGLAELIISTWRRWLVQQHFSFCSSPETLSGQLSDKLPRVWPITCGSCLEIFRVWCKATAHNFARTLQCPQQHLELIVTPSHHAFSCDSAGTGECVVICFLRLDLWMNGKWMASDWLHLKREISIHTKHTLESWLLQLYFLSLWLHTVDKIPHKDLLLYYVSAFTQFSVQRTVPSFI